MTTERETIEALFLELCDLPVASRSAELEKRCGGDQALFDAVWRLLAADGEAPGVVRDLAQRLTLNEMFDTPAVSPGNLLGPYRLVERIGRGGMGDVWRAARYDGAFDGDVAIKLLRIEASDDLHRQRFAREARLQARLNHPNVARLLDVSTADGQPPFLVLELVTGEPIDVYGGRMQEVEEILRLFLDVLQGVAHAHAHLVIHRDIKPSNILVTPDGTAKLLDFGVAAIVDEARTSTPSTLTAESGAALTRRFASPEQIAGEPLTTATDIYSLGLVLFVLLTGKNPRDDAGDSYAELLEDSRRPLPRPSSLCTDPGRQRALLGDLDNILGKAVAVDPGERYGTVADFAADLRRHLANEPVTAHPPTLAYRSAKFVRRHRGAVTATALTATALVLAAGITAWQSIEAKRERDLARYHQAQAEASADFTHMLLNQFGPATGIDSLPALLEHGADLIDMQANADPEVLAHLRINLARNLHQLGYRERATELLAGAAAAARSAGDDNLTAAALCFEARVAGIATDEARTIAARGLEIFEHAGYLSPFARSACYRAQAMLYMFDDDLERAAATMQRAIIEAGNSTSVTYRTHLMNELSYIQWRLMRITDSLRLNEGIVRLLEESGQAYSVGHVVMMINTTASRDQVGEFVSAHAQRMAFRNRLGPLWDQYRFVGQLGLHVGTGYLNLGRNLEALAEFDAYRAGAFESGRDREVLIADMRRGKALMRLGDLDAAQAALDSARAGFDEDTAENTDVMRLIDLTEAELLLKRGRSDDAWSKVAPVLSKLGYPQSTAHPIMIYALHTTATVALARGDLDGADSLIDDLLDLTRRYARPGQYSGHVGQALLRRAELLEARGQPGAAQESLAEALPNLAAELGDAHPDTALARRLAGA